MLVIHLVKTNTDILKDEKEKKRQEWFDGFNSFHKLGKGSVKLQNLKKFQKLVRDTMLTPDKAKP